MAIDDWGLVPLTDLERRHLLEVLDDVSGLSWERSESWTVRS